MQTKRTILGIVTTAILAVAASAHAATAAESFANGERLLAKGEFASALQAYATAVRADRNNQEYMQRYAMVRRIVELRNRLESETTPQQWEYMVRALRSFYATERIYPELLALDKEIHARLGSGESAALLAETQLAMNENASAVDTLSSLEQDKRTPMAQLLLGIAMARTGKADEAMQAATQISLPKDAGPSVTYTAARLQAATGNSTEAVALLKACFEETLPSQLENFKSHAKTCSEFAAMASTREFADVMKTESKVSESKCSGGSSCAGCPMRNKCPKSQGKQD